MKAIASVIAVLFILAGSVFFLQGIRVLPSAVMYGKMEWVIIGAALLIIGVALILFVNRQRIRSLFPSSTKKM